MGYDNQTPGQQAQSDEPFFAVSKTVVFEDNARSGGLAHFCASTTLAASPFAVFEG